MNSTFEGISKVDTFQSPSKQSFKNHLRILSTDYIDHFSTKGCISYLSPANQREPKVDDSTALKQRLQDIKELKLTKSQKIALLKGFKQQMKKQNEELTNRQFYVKQENPINEYDFIDEVLDQQYNIFTSLKNKRETSYSIQRMEGCVEIVTNLIKSIDMKIQILKKESQTVHAQDKRLNYLKECINKF